MDDIPVTVRLILGWLTTTVALSMIILYLHGTSYAAELVAEVNLGFLTDQVAKLEQAAEAHQTYYQQRIKAERSRGTSLADDCELRLGEMKAMVDHSLSRVTALEKR